MVYDALLQSMLSPSHIFTSRTVSALDDPAKTRTFIERNTHVFWHLILNTESCIGRLPSLVNLSAIMNTKKSSWHHPASHDIYNIWYHMLEDRVEDRVSDIHAVTGSKSWGIRVHLILHSWTREFFKCLRSLHCGNFCTGYMEINRSTFLEALAVLMWLQLEAPNLVSKKLPRF